MSYCKVLKQMQREQKRKRKQEQELREYEQKLNENIILAEVMHSLRSQRESEKKIKTLHQLREWARTEQAQIISNRISWIVWDLINYDYYKCINDIERGRQSKIDVIRVIDSILSLDFIKPITEELNNFKSYIIN